MNARVNETLIPGQRDGAGEDSSQAVWFQFQKVKKYHGRNSQVEDTSKIRTMMSSAVSCE